jgi:hypothetical protein
VRVAWSKLQDGLFALQEQDDALNELAQQFAGSLSVASAFSLQSAAASLSVLADDAHHGRRPAEAIESAAVKVAEEALYCAQQCGADGLSEGLGEWLSTRQATESAPGQREDGKKGGVGRPSWLMTPEEGQTYVDEQLSTSLSAAAAATSGGPHVMETDDVVQRCVARHRMR